MNDFADGNKKNQQLKFGNPAWFLGKGWLVSGWEKNEGSGLGGSIPSSDSAGNA